MPAVATREPRRPLNAILVLAAAGLTVGIVALIVFGLLPLLETGAVATPSEQSDAVATVRPTPRPEAREVITFDGEGVGQSRPFSLTGPVAAIGYLATDTSGFGCVFIADVVPVGGTVLEAETFANLLVDADSGVRAESPYYFYRGPGRYYLSVNSTCEFAVFVVE